MEGFRQRAYEYGEADGQTKHLVSLICKKMAKGKSVEQIADDLEENVSKIHEIYDIAVGFGPDYDVEKIMKKMGVGSDERFCNPCGV